MLVASVIGGAIWVLVPALACIYLGVTEVVTTLMLNFVAILWMTYFALNVWPPTPESADREQGSRPGQSCPGNGRRNHHRGA